MPETTTQSNARELLWELVKDDPDLALVECASRTPGTGT